MKRFIGFVAVSGVATIVDFGMRFAFSTVVSYAVAIVLSRCVGIAVAFTLNRLFVFHDTQRAVGSSLAIFVMVNLVSLTQTLVVALAFNQWVFEPLGFGRWSEGAAHAVALVSQAPVSFYLHRRFSFGVRRADAQASPSSES